MHVQIVVFVKHDTSREFRRRPLGHSGSLLCVPSGRLAMTRIPF
jgi:hypothetical protein